MATQHLQTTRLLKGTMHRYFQRLDACAAEGRKVAWCTSVGPAELLRSFGFEVYFPENHGALLGATRAAGDLIPGAVKLGYAADICSYLTSDIGAFLHGTTPLEAHYGVSQIPRPDLLVYCTNQCREVQEWFAYYSRTFEVPMAGVHPPRHLDEVTADDVANVVAQFKALIPICEEVSGSRFDEEAFRESVRMSREAAVLWRKVLETAQSTPVPFDFFDGCIHMAPIVVLRGTQEAVDYYATLLSELEVAMSESTGAPEVCRLYWDGMPVWGRLRAQSELMLRMRASVVASTYCNSWVFDTMDERTPFESTARAYAEIFINRSEKTKEQMLAAMAAEYRVDGIIFHDARTCFNNSNARFGMPARLRKSTGIPTIVVEGDLCDLRFYSDGQTTTKLEAFIDQLADISITL